MNERRRPESLVFSFSLSVCLVSFLFPFFFFFELCSPNVEAVAVSTARGSRFAAGATQCKSKKQKKTKTNGSTHRFCASSPPSCIFNWSMVQSGSVAGVWAETLHSHSFLHAGVQNRSRCLSKKKKKNTVALKCWLPIRGWVRFSPTRYQKSTTTLCPFPRARMLSLQNLRGEKRKNDQGSTFSLVKININRYINIYKYILYILLILSSFCILHSCKVCFK